VYFYSGNWCIFTPALTSVDISSRSVAILGSLPGFCVLALDPNMSNAIEASSDSELEAKDCNTVVNSSSPTAISMSGGSEIETNALYVVGDISTGSENNIEGYNGVITGTSTVADPLIDIDPPGFGGCDFTNLVITSDQDLNPGVYCGGLTIENEAEVDLSSGNYIFVDGDLFLREEARMDEGNNVTFFLVHSGNPNDTGSLRITDHSSIEFNAPSSGAYAGIAVYQNRDAPAAGFNTISGISSGSGPAPELRVDGHVYLPAQELRMDGDALLRIEVSGCGKMIAKSYKLSDDARLRVDCEDQGPVGAQVRLVE
jgi:hypothetical protein